MPISKQSSSGILVLLAASASLQGAAAGRQDCSAETLARSFRVAHAYQNRAEYVQAERAFREALECQKQSLPANDLTIRVTVTNLGELMRLQRRFKEAETLLMEAESLHESAGTTEHPAFASVLLSLASMYKDRKQCARAEPLARRALAIFENSTGPGTREVVAALNTLAVLHVAQDDWDGAERHLRRAFAEWRGSPDDTALAAAQHNLGNVLFQKGNLAEAEVWLFRALDMRRRLLGIHHPTTLLTLGACERLLNRTNRKTDARELRTLLKTAAR